MLKLEPVTCWADLAPSWSNHVTNKLSLVTCETCLAVLCGQGHVGLGVEIQEKYK